jgi:EmrB/QacA subfamily drug resistance transporter
MAASVQQGTRRWWALVAIAISVLVIGLDLTVLNLALPTLARDLHASTSDLQWFASAYSLVLAAALLPAGLLGDRFGRKKVLMIALAVFGASSAACAYSSSSGVLIAARAFLGLGAAAVLPLSLSVLPVFFTDSERPKAIAVVMGATFLGYPVGPLLGGWLLDNFWWGSVFLINVPVVVLAVIAVGVLLPESRSARRPRVDIPGVLISSGGLAALTYGFIKAGQNGWSDAAAVAAIAGGAVLLAVFAGWERIAGRRAAAQPLIDLGLFRSASFTVGTLLTTLVSFALFGILFGMPQYFQDVRGLDALGSGVRLLPLIGGMVAGMLAGSRLQAPRMGEAGAAPGGPAAVAGAPRVSAKALVAAGFTVMAAALVAGAFTRTGSGSGFTATWFALTGAGLGLAIPSAMNAALGALSAERSGSGSALISAMRQVGATIGVAVLGSVISSAYRSHLAVGNLPAPVADAVRSSAGVGVAAARKLGSPSLLAAVRGAYVHGLDLMLWVCGGIALASALVALALLPRVAGSPRPAGAATGEMPAGQAEWQRGADVGS